MSVKSLSEIKFEDIGEDTDYIYLDDNDVLKLLYERERMFDGSYVVHVILTANDECVSREGGNLPAGKKVVDVANGLIPDVVARHAVEFGIKDREADIEEWQTQVNSLKALMKQL